MGDWYADYLAGGADNDLIMGRAGHDVLDGGEGKDTIFGGVGCDTIIGGAGDDKLAGMGFDGIVGETDQARLAEYEAFSDNDVIYGGDDNDILDKLVFREGINPAAIRVEKKINIYGGGYRQDAINDSGYMLQKKQKKIGSSSRCACRCAA